jgi:hypothetical protein
LGKSRQKAVNVKKRLHHNGVYICDFDASGDAMRDIEVVNRLLAERGLDQKVTLEWSMFNQANSFSIVSADIYEKHLMKPPPNGAAMSPFVVNTAFAIELFLKTLAMQHGKKLHGHEIKKLFKKLPGAAKDQIDRQLGKISSTSQWAGEIKTMRNLQDVLDEIDTAFVDWRYLHENTSKALKITFTPTIFLAEILHAATAENLVNSTSVTP